MIYYACGLFNCASSTINSNVDWFSGDSSSTDSNVSQSVSRSYNSFCTLVKGLYGVMH